MAIKAEKKGKKESAKGGRRGGGGGRSRREEEANRRNNEKTNEDEKEVKEKLQRQNRSYPHDERVTDNALSSATEQWCSGGSTTATSIKEDTRQPKADRKQ